jgi:hypothetical protein
VLADVDVIHLPYIKAVNEISYYEKEFTSINVSPVDIVEKDFVLFIPDKSPGMEDIYRELKREFNVLIVGDMRSGLYDRNITLKLCNYIQNNYQTILSYIMKSKMVITPLPQWAFVTNLQEKPLFYWGNDASLYKNDGVYGFENENSHASNINTDIIRQIMYQYGKLKGTGDK